jgi:Gene product 88
MATRDVTRWTTGALESYVGGLSNPSKMPGYAYGLPAEDCQVGGRLRDVVGSTCSSCYAYERGAYRWKGVKAAYRRRARSIRKALWVRAMAELITRKSKRVPYFRWHDSGDIQSVEHFARICEVAQLTPHISHWIPTREYRYVSAYVDSGGLIPENLNVRMSAHMVGGHVPTFPRLRGLVTTSTVSAGAAPAGAFDCPSRFQSNECADCRACWARDVPTVSYHLH